MNTNEHESLDGLARTIIGAAYEVSNCLGCGFLEKVYERAMTRELGARGLAVKSQVRYLVDYKGSSVGEYLADLVVDDQIIVELKCVDAFATQHLAVCLNYLRASGLRLALLINFQKPKVEWKRIIV
jgi:GxxExxY protein